MVDDCARAPIPFAGCFAEETPQRLSRGDLAFIGLPDDSRSSFRKGAAQGPRSIREHYDGRAYNSSSESGLDLRERVFDLGDWKPSSSWETTRADYRARAGRLLKAGVRPFFVGGDHAVTIPLGEALSSLNNPVHIVQFDAHPDFYPDFRGDRFSHACVGSRLAEMPHVASLTQMGIRTLNSTQREALTGLEQRVRILEAGELSGALPFPSWIPYDADLWVTLDIDALDPCYAPGVSHPVPGGLSSRLLLDWFRDLPWRLIGMDVVEINPMHDLNGQTAIAAGRILHQAMAAALRPQPRSPQ